ncbi:MAG: hypothetical protein PUC65_12745 [Clostridiales bacterium]|nr:hypothetical protein [Clostridiales bacterium]
MTVKEKQEYFYQMAIESATAQNVSMVKEYEEQLAKESKELEEQLNESYTRKLKATKENLLRENNSKVSFKTLELRHEYNEQNDQLKDDLFEQVKAQVKAFCKTDTYQQKLLNQIKAIVDDAKGLKCNVKVMPQDYEFVMAQNLPVNINVIKSDKDFWGGCKAFFEEKKMVIDHTFEYEFEECKQNFQFHLTKETEVRA